MLVTLQQQLESIVDGILDYSASNEINLGDVARVGRDETAFNACHKFH